MEQVTLDTIWVLVAGMLVFFMNLGFAMVESGFARSKNTVNILSKNFIVFAVSSLGFLVLGWGLMFGDGNGFIGLKGLFMAGGLDNSPAVGDAYQGVYTAISWTGVPFWAKFFLSAGVLRHGGYHRFGRGGRAHQVHLVYRILTGFNHVHLPDHRALDLGRRLARCARVSGLCRFNRRALRRRLGGAGRCDAFGAALRQIRTKRTAQRDPRPQHAHRDDRPFRAVARLVRV